MYRYLQYNNIIGLLDIALILFQIHRATHPFKPRVPYVTYCIMLSIPLSILSHVNIHPSICPCIHISIYVIYIYIYIYISLNIVLRVEEDFSRSLRCYADNVAKTGHYRKHPTRCITFANKCERRTALCNSTAFTLFQNLRTYRPLAKTKKKIATFG